MQLRTPTARGASGSIAALYAMVFGVQFIFITYLPIYLGELKFTSLQIGALTSVGYAVTIFAQSFWSAMADRSATKNRVLALLVLGTCVLSVGLLFRGLHTFPILLGLISALYFFMKPVQSLTDTIALEAQGAGIANYGRVRSIGTLGYAACGIAISLLPGLPVTAMFAAFSAVMLLCFVPLRFFPVAAGAGRGRSRVNALALLKNRQLLPVMVFGMLMAMLLNYRLTFFPVYFTGTLGYSKGLISFYTAALILLQVPVLAVADRTLGRLNMYTVLLVSAVCMALGYVVAVFTTDKVLLVFVNVFHSLASVLLSWCGAVFINRVAPPELKASGQGLWAAINGGLGPVAGNLIGGAIGSALGGVYNGFVCFLIVSIGIVLFFLVFFSGKQVRLAE